jgi:hypothetical protein
MNKNKIQVHGMVADTNGIVRRTNRMHTPMTARKSKTKVRFTLRFPRLGGRLQIRRTWTSPDCDKGAHQW